MNQYFPLIDRMDADLYNHGKDGMKTQLTQFITTQTVREEERAKVDKRRSRIHYWWLALLSGLILLLIGFLLNLVSNHHISQAKQGAVAAQNADNPPY